MTRREEAMEMLDQLETLLTRLDKPDAKDRTTTALSLLMVTRAVYWLLERYAREHGTH